MLVVDMSLEFLHRDLALPARHLIQHRTGLRFRDLPLRRGDRLSERLPKLDGELGAKYAMGAIQQMVFQANNRRRSRSAEVAPNVPNDLLVRGMHNSH